jgi:hypothetical protein
VLIGAMISLWVGRWRNQVPSVNSPECVEGEFSEVRGAICDQGLLGGTCLFHERLQIPHDLLGPIPVHRVAGLGVDLQGGIGDRFR